MYHYPRLRDLREDHDLKQQTVASLLQISQQQYSLYETVEREIPLHLFIQLADYYQISLDYLASKSDIPTGADHNGNQGS